MTDRFIDRYCKPTCVKYGTLCDTPTCNVDESEDERGTYLSIYLMEECPDGHQEPTPELSSPLTWQDMLIIHRHIKDAMNRHIDQFQSLEGQQRIYQEVLEKFLKEREG